MTLNELIEKLNDIVSDNEEAGDCEVRLATQASYPFEYDISDEVVVVDELGSQNETIVYIAEARQIGYLPGAVANAIGWGRR